MKTRREPLWPMRQVLTGINETPLTAAMSWPRCWSWAIRGPAGEGRVAAVGRVDVAAVAEAVLREPEAHAGATYTLTGPEALTLAEIAARAGAALGRELRFVDESEEEAYAWRGRQYGAEQWQLDAWVSTYTAIRDGSVAAVTDDVRRVTGRPPRTLEQVLHGD